MKSAAYTLSLLVSVALLWLGPADAAAQSTCPANPLIGTASERPLPQYSSSIPVGSNFSTGAGSGYLYVLTKWGFTRGNLADPANPSGFNILNIGQQYFNGGLIPVTCDCHQGGDVFEAAEAPDGSSRMLSDFVVAYTQGGSFAPGQLARTEGSGGVTYGQQVKLSATGSGSVPFGARLGAVYAPSTGKYFGYVPTPSGVAVIDLTNTTGSTSLTSALRPSSFLNWTSPSYAVRLKAARVTVGTSDLYLLAGVTDDGRTLRIGTINPSTGFVTETASISTTAAPYSLWIAAVDGRAFVFSAERAALRVYEYASGTLVPAGSIPGVDMRRVIVKGGQFPAIFVQNRTSSTRSVIEIYDTKWLVRGGSPTKAYSLPLYDALAPLGGYADNVYEAIVKTNGPTVTAYVYRLKSSEFQTGELEVVAQALDISCLSADSTAPPVAHASGPGPGVSPAIPNYFGDRARLSNDSSSGAALTQAQWDLSVASVGGTATFQADAAFSGPLPDANLTVLDPVYLPCDPSGSPAGNPRTGENCYASVNSPADGSQFQYGLQVWNTNGPSATPFISAPVTYHAPLAGIVGLDATNRLSVLQGEGTADASASQGNHAEARKFWTFSTPTGPLVGADIDTTNPVVSIPGAATGFRLRVTYRGGYVAPEIAGTIVQQDLVQRASGLPNPVVKNGAFTLTNNMLKASAATLNSVGWAITSSSTPPTSFTSQLAASFLTVGGTDTVTAPGTPGTYWVHLSYNYSVSGSAQPPAIFSLQLEVVDQIILTLTASPTSAEVGQTITFTASGGPPSSTYGWHFGDVLPSAGFTSGGATSTHAYSSGGTFNVTACVTSAPNTCIGTPAVTSVTILASAPPPPPPPGGVTASLSCPSQGSIGTPTTCTATASGGSGGYTYRWNWGDGFTTFESGPATHSHTYSVGGTYTVTVQVTSSGQTAYATDNVTIGTGGPPPSGLSVTLACPTSGTAGSPVTCAATASGGTGSYSYRWNWGDSFSQLESGPATNSHTYSSAGGYNVAVVVTSGSSTGTGTANVNITRAGPPSPASDYQVSGATPNFQGIYEIEAGRTITLTATEPDPGASFSWAVSGGGPTLTGRTVQHTFNSQGSRTITLTVTGGGTVTYGTTSTQIRFSITAPRFQALMIPGAGHIDPAPPATDGTWATDLSITNPGTQPMTVTLYYEPFGTTFPADLSLIQFDSRNSASLAAGQSLSKTDIVTQLLPPKSGRGVLILKYEGGNADPIATATVYFTQQGRSFGSSLPTFKVGPYGSATTQSPDAGNEQTLVGLRNDANYRFNVSLFNASGQSGFFRLTAFGEDGTPLTIRDDAGAPAASRDLPIGPFQQALLQAGDLGLDDATKRYVLKASPVSGGSALIAAASALDRRNNDLVQVSDDTPRISAAADGTIEYFIPGVGRIGRDEVSSDPHWKTDLTLYSSSNLSRDLSFEYRYTDARGAEQQVLAPVTIGPGRSLVIDDVVGSLLDGYAPADLKQESTLGVLRIYYPAAADSATAPLLIGGRIYDDRGSAGTAGMQLFVYSNGESVAPGNPLVLPGAQQNLRFRTNIGFFAMGEAPTTVRVTAVKQDGTIAGTYDFMLNDGSRTGHYAQLPMSAIPGIVGEPMTIRVEVLDGSRIGAYVVTVDQISSDTIFVQGRPTRMN
jgi:PKD repeat protein